MSTTKKDTKPDYIKEITDSLKEGAIITAVTIGEFMILKYLFKMPPPSAKARYKRCRKIIPWYLDECSSKGLCSESKMD